MITLSNGHKFDYMAASGALAFDGRGWPWERPLFWAGLIDPSLFTIVLKTLTREPRVGNLKLYKPWTCVKLIPGGVVNAVGLTNPGIDVWCDQIAPMIDFNQLNLVGSILSNLPDDLVYMAKRMSQFNLRAIEINWSCPNTQEHGLKDARQIIDGTLAVSAAVNLPIILKLGVTHEADLILNELASVVEAVSINSVPWSIVFPNSQSPLAKFGGGGVSGQAAQVQNWEFMRRIAKLERVPVIGPSPWSFLDLHFLRNRGAQAISFGSLFLRHPSLPTKFVKMDLGG